MKNIIKWPLRIAGFFFVLVIWSIGGMIAGIAAGIDWMLHPDEWNGINNKKKGENKNEF